MKAEYTGYIQEIFRRSDVVKLKLVFDGSVENFKQEAKKTTMDVVLEVKPIVADSLKIGSKFTITLEDDSLDPDMRE